MKETDKKRTRSPTPEKTANVPGSTSTKQPFAPTTDAEDAEQHGLTEHRWASILNYAWEPCSLCRHVAEEPLTHRHRSIEDALGSKSNGTLLKRSRAILFFEVYCQKQRKKLFSDRVKGLWVVPTMPVFRPAEHNILRRHSNSQKETSASKGLLTLHRTDLQESLVREIMRTCATEDTFSSEGVAFENMVRNASDVVGRDNRVCGCICFLIHCRARCGDANYVTEKPTLDFCDGHGDIEASTRKAKVLDEFTKQGRAPPLVRHSHGLPGVPWAYEWLRLRKDAGLDANRTRCLLPPLKWVHRLPTSGLATWLQKVIAQLQFSADLLLQDHIAVLGSKGQSKTWHPQGFGWTKRSMPSLWANTRQLWKEQGQTQQSPQSLSMSSVRQTRAPHGWLHVNNSS